MRRSCRAFGEIAARLGDRLGFCRSSHERAYLRIHRHRGLRHWRADVARVLTAGKTLFRARRSRRAALAADRLCSSTAPAGCAIRAACSPVAFSSRDACGDYRHFGRPQSHAGDRALPPRCRSDGGESLCGGTVGARRRRSRSRGGRDRYGRRYDDHCGIRGRAFRARRWFCPRRAARHHGSRARAQCPGFRRRTHQDACTAASLPELPTIAT